MKMERYLFRGKTFTGQWVFGDLIQYPNSTQIGRLTFDEEISFIKVKKKTVGQFTGILDKNGNRIFEGDIIESGLRPIYEITDIHEFYYECYEYHQVRIGEQSEDMKIIGNIHDK